MKVKYVNCDYVKKKYNLTLKEFNDCLEMNILCGIKTGHKFLFKKNDLPKEPLKNKMDILCSIGAHE